MHSTSCRGVACRAIKDLHHETAEKLGVDVATREEVDTLLTQLQQLLVGISIMQVAGWLGKRVRFTLRPVNLAACMPAC